MTAPALADVTLTQLAYVVALDTHRHFGKAAAACHVTQPTLSMQLGKLERALGVTLFDRSRTPVVPTDVGALVAAQARVTLREAARISEIRDDALGIVAGELRLGVIPTIAPYVLPRVVQELARRHPHLRLVVEERVTDDVLAGLRRDTLDAAVIATPADGSDLVERPLYAEAFLGYVSSGHRLAGHASITPSDLSLDDVWLLAEGHCFRTQAVALCRQRRRRAAPHVAAGAAGARFESGNLETLRRLVDRGLGMTLLPALAAAELPAGAQRRRLVPFASPAPAREIRLVRRRTDLKRHLVEAVVDVLLDTLPPEAHRLAAASERPPRRRRPVP